MAKNVQVRNVPERLHRALVRRAKKRGQTLTAYVQSVLEDEVSRPLPEEVFDRIESREPVELGGESIVEIIRREREERERRIASWLTP